MIYLKDKKNGYIKEVSDSTWAEITKDPAVLADFAKHNEILGPNPEQQAYISDEPNVLEKITTGLLSGATSGLVERDDDSLIGGMASMTGGAARDFAAKRGLARLGVSPRLADIGVDVASGAAEGAIAEGAPGAAVGGIGAVLGRLIPGGDKIMDKVKKGAISRIKSATTPEYSSAKKAAEAARELASKAEKELLGTTSPVGPPKAAVGLKIPQAGISPTDEMMQRDALGRLRKETQVGQLKGAAEAAELKQMVTGLEQPVAQAQKIKRTEDLIDMVPNTIKSTLGREGTLAALQMALADPALAGIPPDQVSFPQFLAALGRAAAVIKDSMPAGSKEYRINKVISRMTEPPKPQLVLPRPRSPQKPPSGSKY